MSIIKVLVLSLLIGVLAPDTSAWGFYAHKEINRIAVFTLPTPLIGFYKSNIKYITEHAVDADRRRYSLAEEACRHYLDADHYEHSLPFDTIPKYWKKAIEMYTKDTLFEYGIVPWHVNYTYQQLIWTFADTSRNLEQKTRRILRLSADLGHYVGDLHVPLHSTSNYNGQKTNQVGIHALWESRIPPLFDTGYNYFVGRAKLYENPIDSIWKAISKSYFLVDSVLILEREATSIVGQSNKYTFISTEYATKREYSIPFCTAYNRLMGNMIEERMTKSILFLGSLWYTAWIEAGQPNLEGFPTLDYELEEKSKKPQQAKMIGRQEE